jgi:hypothetical protein
MIWILLYIISVVFFFGVFFAFWQRNYPTFAVEQYKIDFVASLIFALFWPLSVWAYLTDSKPLKGFKYW